MLEISDIQQTQILVNELRLQGCKIGLVPTMGAFHEGHLALMRQLKPQVDFLIVSLFVNPIQFGKNEDLSKYPRRYAQDKAMAENVGVDCIFKPEVKDMYPEDFHCMVHIDSLTETLCGAYRTGHFDGVTTVVLKLFNICKPHVAIFGQKDAQQAIVLNRMVQDLNLDIQMEIGKTIREADGLAMSSRNAYLSPNERQLAPFIYGSLLKARESFKTGEQESIKLKEIVTKSITSVPEFKLQYAEIVDLNTLQPLNYIANRALFAVVAFLGTTRLIDNVILGEPETLW